ncbi:unnamed protein product [Cyprideis torosa]|uniref:Uncharacterized protein n=1 Tax=Cyprideis torosa TaxID=163714 RepID=A0A7R8W2C1_9CRUS|nr:unnamed protein product [Cyprideis torosa]CAG0881696.1 unnamed protein product [Cyprideis torosa]
MIFRFLTLFLTTFHLLMFVDTLSINRPIGWKANPELMRIACGSFVQPTEDRRFFSPNYPEKYPNNTDCYFVLEAPEGNLIKLDFLGETFELETSLNCTYDFLEIRDGLHGYSALIGRYCGSKFPPKIVSSGRFLWLRFNSDDTVEYSGFQARFDYIANPLEERERSPCQFSMGGLHGAFSHKDIPPEQFEYTRATGKPLDCTWRIEVEDQWKVYLTVPVFDLASPNACSSNFLEIFGEKTDMVHRIDHFCSSLADRVLSKTNVLHVRFYLVQGKALDSKFTANWTAVREKSEEETSCRIPQEFDCDDGQCIDSSLRCDGLKNCKFNWDEVDCEPKNKGNKLATSHILVIMTIGCLLLAGMCFIMAFNCIQKLRHDHKTYRARRSMENSLAQLPGTATPRLERYKGSTGDLNVLYAPTQDVVIVDRTNASTRGSLYGRANGLISLKGGESETGSRLTLTRGVQTVRGMSDSSDDDDEEDDRPPPLPPRIPRDQLSDSSDERLLVGRRMYRRQSPPRHQRGESAQSKPKTHSTRTLPCSLNQVEETTPRFRAEAVIEMGGREDAPPPRPQSRLSHVSTKSAPDVIALH